ncbi:MAG: hypothetical protein ACJA0S_000445 [Rickettsiales bacterium]|jgi:hypothetical protein
MKKKWTVVMVTHNSIPYVAWQLKSLYEFNNPNDFKVIIVENNSFEEKREIEKLSNQYNNFDNIEVLYHQSGAKESQAGFSDGIGSILREDIRGKTLDHVIKMVDTKYLLINDPHFFWLKKNYLNFLESYLQKGYLAVGAPPPSKVGIGNADFPATFGCAYLTESIKNIGFEGVNHDSEKILESFKIFSKSSGYSYSMGTGYKIRSKLSSGKYISFAQNKPVKEKFYNNLSKYIGVYGLSNIRYYFIEGVSIGVYMLGGGRSCKQMHELVYLDNKQQDSINKSWVKNRFLYSKYFYSLIKHRRSSGELDKSFKYYLSFVKRLKINKSFLEQKKLSGKLMSLNSDKKKWTIGMVNYNSFIYLPYQLKILYEFNDPNEFDLVIVDNTLPHQKEELENLKKLYAKYNNIKIIYHNPTKSKTLKGSLCHAEGLNLVLDSAETPYLLVHDPDFFWVKKNHLKILESHLLQGNLAVGAPYFNRVKIGKGDFPAAFGCAYFTDSLKRNDLNFDIGKTYEEVAHEHKDVGWKMRGQFSDNNYVSFEQKNADIKEMFGSHSFEMKSKEYFLGKEKIAYHLYRGSFTSGEKEHKESTTETAPPEWESARKKYALFFYLLIKGMNRKKIIKIINKK